MTKSSLKRVVRPRFKTVEKDQGFGWIARNPYDGSIIPDDDFRWNTRESARTVVWEARLLTKPKNAHPLGEGQFAEAGV